MFYFSSPIIETGASVLVVPCSADLTTNATPLQEQVIKKFGEKYWTSYLEDVMEGQIREGLPGLWEPDEDGPTIISLPVSEDGRDYTLLKIFEALKETVQLFVTFRDTGNPQKVAIAVPKLSKHYLWHNFEECCRRLELKAESSGLEFWLYPPEEEDSMKEKDEEEMLV